MARIAGVDLPLNKRIDVALTYIYGIGAARSARILATADVPVAVRVKDLTEEQTKKIRQIITDEGRVEGDLRKNTQMDIKRLIEIGCYRGTRHRMGLPVRGQRTHTNARTKKGPRIAVAGKKKVKKSESSRAARAPKGEAPRDRSPSRRRSAGAERAENAGPTAPGRPARGLSRRNCCRGDPPQGRELRRVPRARPEPPVGRDGHRPGEAPAESNNGESGT